MGLLGDLFSGKIKDGVEGTAQIVSCTGHRGEGVMQNCRMQLVVSAEGVEPTAVEHHALIHNRRWPRPGMTLPAVVSRSDPTRFKVNWKAIPDSREQAKGNAEAIAASMRGGGAPGGLPGNIQVIDASGTGMADLTDEQQQKLRSLGIDPAALAAQAGAPAPSGGGDDPVAKLEKLADLRDRGALTDAEFEDQKKKLLGG